MTSKAEALPVSNEHLELIKEWNRTNAQLKELKEREMELRLRVQREVFPATSDELMKGTERRACGGGRFVKLVSKINYSFTDQDAVDAVLDEIEASGPEGAIYAKRVLKVTYDLVVSEFEKMPSELREKLSKIVVRKQATPTLEVEMPKAKS